ncbi:MAG: potassium channel family protein [Flavobacteriales bacterium]
MRTTKILFKYIVIYLGVILVFGTFYCAYWHLHPDSFIINEQFGLQPFSSPTIQGDEAKDLRYFQHKTDSLLKLINENEARLPLLLATSDSLELLAKSASDKNQRIMWQKADAWEAAQMPDSLTRRVQALSTAIAASGTSITDELQRATLSLDKAKLEYDIAVIKASSGGYVLHHLTSFMDSAASAEAWRIDSLWAQYEYRKVPQAEELRYSLNYELEHLKYSAMAGWSERLSFFDFILFSASNASTVTYGEMLPNDTTMRISLFVQAIVCIVLIAMFIDRVSASRRDHTYSTILGSPFNHLLNCYVEYAETLNTSRTWANGGLRAPEMNYFNLSESDFKEIVIGLFYDNRPGQVHQGFTWLLEVGRGTTAKAREALEQALSYKSALDPEIAKCVEEIREGYMRMDDVTGDVSLYPPKYSREIFTKDSMHQQAGIQAPFEVGGYAAILFRFVQAHKMLFRMLPLRDITPPVLYDGLMERLKHAHGKGA